MLILSTHQKLQSFFSGGQADKADVKARGISRSAKTSRNTSIQSLLLEYLITFSSKWYICRSGLQPACPFPYTYQAGDVEGQGFRSFTSVDKISSCAGHCENTNGCCSFEFSPREESCHLNKECEPTHGVYKDFTFCVKGNYREGITTFD